MASRDSSGSLASPRTPISPVMPLTLQQKVIHKDLIKKGIPALILWLDKIKIEALTSANTEQVKSPFNASYLKTKALTGKYTVILKWCVENIPDYDFGGIPSSIGYKIPGKAIKTHGAPGAATASTSRTDNTIEDWLKNPLKDGDGKSIEVSLHQTSPYFKLYTRSFTYLNTMYNRDNKPITKELYQKIHDKLPKLHIYEFKINDDVGPMFTTYTYDHLMMKTLSSYNISENPEDDKFFITEYDIFEEIYIQIEKLLKIYKYKHETINVLISSIDINSIFFDYTYRLLEYVANIKRFDKNNLGIKIANLNMELTYKNIVLDKFKVKLYFYIYDKRFSTGTLITYDKLVDAHSNYYIKHYHQSIDSHESYIIDVRKHVFYFSNKNSAIIDFIKTAIFDISDLYEESKIDVDEYLPITEDEIKPPPLYPSPPVQRSTIVKYIMLKKKIKLTKSVIEESTGKKRADLESELEEYNQKMASNYIISECEDEIKEHDKKLVLYKLDVQKYERDLAIYKKNVLGKRGKFLKNSNSPTRDLHFTPVKTRAYKSESPSKNLASSSPSKNSGRNYISNCINDSDPLTQEAFEDMSDKKLKNLTKIITTITTSDNKKKKIVTCYDTVSLYNYILECHNKNTIPYNIGLGRDFVLTNDDKNRVKRNIRAFTFNKTLPPIIIKDFIPSYTDTNDKKVFGRLIDVYIKPYYITNRNATVIGYHAIKLNITIGGIKFDIFNDIHMNVPMLVGDSMRESGGDIPMITMIYSELLKNKMSGNLFTNNYFPYRKNKEFIMKIPNTNSMFLNNANEDELIVARDRFYRSLTLM